MKEKRYFCDLIFETMEDNEDNKAFKSLLNKIMLVSTIAIIVVSSMIAYNIAIYKHCKELEAYSGSAYEYKMYKILLLFEAIENGLFTYMLIGYVFLICCIMAGLISKIHKKRDKRE